MTLHCKTFVNFGASINHAVCVFVCVFTSLDLFRDSLCLVLYSAVRCLSLFVSLFSSRSLWEVTALALLKWMVKLIMQTRPIFVTQQQQKTSMFILKSSVLVNSVSVPILAFSSVLFFLKYFNWTHSFCNSCSLLCSFYFILFVFIVNPY